MSKEGKTIEGEIDCPNCGVTIAFEVNSNQFGLELPDEPQTPTKIVKAIPIFFNNNYEPNACVGTMSYNETGSIDVALFDGYSLSEKEVFENFGNVSYYPKLKVKDRLMQFQIKCFNLSPPKRPKVKPDEDEGETDGH